MSIGMKDPDRLWLSMADGNRTRILSRSLAKGMDMVVYMGPTLDQEGPVGLVLADDAHSGRIAEARKNAAPNQRSILVTAAAKRTVAADIYVDHDCDTGTLSNAVEGLKAFRDFEMSAGKNAQWRPGAFNALQSGEFVLRTLADARDVAMLLSGSSPRPCQTAVGAYVLLAGAIEHGNLEFSATDKAKALAEGKWARMVERRLEERAYVSRRVKLSFKRGSRLLSMIIQDDGPGYDAETAEMANPARAGYRGKGIKLAKSLGFTQINYSGTGNILEASLLVPQQTGRQAA